MDWELINSFTGWLILISIYIAYIMMRRRVRIRALMYVAIDNPTEFHSLKIEVLNSGYNNISISGVFYRIRFFVWKKDYWIRDQSFNGSKVLVSQESVDFMIPELVLAEHLNSIFQRYKYIPKRIILGCLFVTAPSSVKIFQKHIGFIDQRQIWKIYKRYPFD